MSRRSLPARGAGDCPWSGPVNGPVRYLTWPITVLTLGLFLLVINALLLRLAAAIVPGFRVAGFMPAFWGALLLSIFSFGLTLVF